MELLLILNPFLDSFISKLTKHKSDILTHFYGLVFTTVTEMTKTTISHNATEGDISLNALQMCTLMFLFSCFEPSDPEFKGLGSLPSLPCKY